MGSLDNAAVYFKALNSVLLHDNQPSIQALSPAMLTESIEDTNLADRQAFQFNNSVETKFYVEEAAKIAKMNEVLQEGDKFLSFLYSYRGCARAIPQVQNMEQENRFDIYEKSYQVLKPQVEKMKHLLSFIEDSINVVVATFKHLIPAKKDAFFSENFLIKMAEIMNMFLTLDTMKNVKTSLNNDFSMYKRVLTNMRKKQDEVSSKDLDETAENQKVYMFLANHDSISKKLKEEVVKIEGYDELLQDILGMALHNLDEGNYFLADAKHLFLKSTAYILNLLDNPLGADEKKKKSIKTEKFMKHVKAFPIIPLFGDLPINLAHITSKITHLDIQKWEFNTNDDIIRQTYSLSFKVDKFRASYNSWMIETTSKMSNVQRDKNGMVVTLDGEQIDITYNHIVHGVKLISEMSTAILEQSAWKYINPAKSNADNVNAYELVVKQNFTKEELSVLSEMIAMVKSASAVLSTHSHICNMVIHQHIYADVQSFMQGPMLECLNHATKKKRATLGLLQHVTNMSTDFDFAANMAAECVKTSPSKDNGRSAASGKKGSASSISMAKASAVSFTQLHFIQVLLENIFSEKSKGMKGGLMREKDYKDNQVELVFGFLKRCNEFLHLIDFDLTLAKCSDLSDLWYKEFYLELTKQIQFPIELSLPWILTNHILENDSVDNLEFLLYPLDIYNDAAHKALHQLKTQFLYDEIEAEVTLCVDQFIYKLSHKIFSYYKTHAACILMDKDTKVHLPSGSSIENGKIVSTNKFLAFLKLKNFELLGRDLNLNKLISQNANRFFRKCIEAAINRFEGSDLSFIIEFEHLLNISKLVHQLLSEHLSLDSWSTMLKEVNEESDATAFNGRIVVHIISEFLGDFLPNYCYNSLTEKNFVGDVHFNALIRLLGPEHLPMIFSELESNVDSLIRNCITPYLVLLVKALPSSNKLPLYEYGAKGTFEFFQATYKPILSYAELKGEIGQSFREIGNALVLVQQLQNAIHTCEVLDVQFKYPFLDPQGDMKYNFINVMKDAQDVLFPEDEQKTVLKLAENIVQFYNSQSDYGFVKNMLKKMEITLMEVKGQWESPAADVFLIDQSTEFYRVWNAIHFMMNIPSNSQDKSLRELFGDSLHWVGAAFICLLGQRHRFEMFDMTKHLQCVFTVEKKENSVNEIVEIMENAKFNSYLLSEAFDYVSFTLNK